MNDIPSVWSFAALLLFGVTLTALPAGAAILLAISLLPPTAVTIHLILRVETALLD